MSSLQELKVWVQAGQQKASEDQNLLPFLFKRDMTRVEWEQVGKEEGSCRTKDILSYCGMDRSTPEPRNQTEVEEEKAMLQTKSQRKQFRGAHSHHQWIHNVALPSNTIYDAPQLYTLRMTVLYLLFLAEPFFHSLFHIIALSHLSGSSHYPVNPLHRSIQASSVLEGLAHTNSSSHNPIPSPSPPPATEPWSIPGAKGHAPGGWARQGANPAKTQTLPPPLLPWKVTAFRWTHVTCWLTSIGPRQALWWSHLDWLKLPQMPFSTFNLYSASVWNGTGVLLLFATHSRSQPLYNKKLIICIKDCDLISWCLLVTIKSGHSLTYISASPVVKSPPP